MPELPEVETARRGIEPYLKGRRVTAVVVRDKRLRWPVPLALKRELTGQRITGVARRAKYLLLHTDVGSAILHLGMSGSLRIVVAGTPAQKHDHVDLVLDSGKALRLHDPRRFGSLLWTKRDVLSHALLKDLGPEPLESGFDGAHLFDLSRGRSAAVKNFLMDSHVVVGVGNIYASEALFMAGIHPKRAVGRVTRASYGKLAKSVQRVLKAAIKAGGTTLRDFSREDGEPGYFRQHLRVYGRDGKACERCGGRIISSVIGQRSSFYCPKCQS